MSKLIDKVHLITNISILNFKCNLLNLIYFLYTIRYGRSTSVPMIPDWFLASYFFKEFQIFDGVVGLFAHFFLSYPHLPPQSDISK